MFTQFTLRTNPLLTFWNPSEGAFCGLLGSMAMALLCDQVRIRMKLYTFNQS